LYFFVYQLNLFFMASKSMRKSTLKSVAPKKGSSSKPMAKNGGMIMTNQPRPKRKAY
jgi:hypothetical protein